MPTKWNKRLSRISIVILMAIFARGAFAQVTYSAEKGGLPLKVGFGVSSYYTEIWVHSRQTGLNAWADWTFRRVPSILKGVGIEAEARDHLWGKPGGSQWSIASLGGGPIYSWQRYRAVRPYAKYIVNYGFEWNISYPGVFPAWCKSDKWVTSALGGGVEFRVAKPVWVRLDYEYQHWKTQQFNATSYLNPQGFTVGAAYDFGVGRRIKR